MRVKIKRMRLVPEHNQNKQEEEETEPEEENQRTNKSTNIINIITFMKTLLRHHQIIINIILNIINITV